MIARRPTIACGFVLALMQATPAALAQANTEELDPQRFQDFKVFLEKAMGPEAIVTPIPFGAVLPRSATTTIQKNSLDKEPRTFAANIIAKREGAALGFVAYGPCTLTDPGAVAERLFKVDGQKIVAHYACKEDKGGTRQGIYLPKSPEGMAFVRKRFETMKYVLVEIDQFPVPFAAAGFDKAWKGADGTAL